MEVPLGQQWCLPHQIGGILKSGTVPLHQMGGSLKTETVCPTHCVLGVFQVPGLLLLPTRTPHRHLPHNPHGLGVEEGAQLPLQLMPHSWQGLGWPLPGFWDQEGLFAFLFGSKPPVLFPTTTSQPHQGTWPRDHQQGPPGSPKQENRPGACNPAAQGAPRPGPGRAQSQAGRSQVWDLPGRATREGPAQLQVGPARLPPGHLEPGPVLLHVLWLVGGAGRGGVDCLPDHVGGWELQGCDLALLAGLWLPCGHFHF